MIFYETITKVGKAIAGWVNENYQPKESVKPRVYHKYIKQEDKERLYPTVDEKEENTDEINTNADKNNSQTDNSDTNQDEQTTNQVEQNPDDDEDPGTI